MDEKKLNICIDSTNQYLIFRYGSENHIELEYPEDKYNSFNLFRYDSYYRGGGIENEATDEKGLLFINGKYEYKFLIISMQEVKMLILE